MNGNEKETTKKENLIEKFHALFNALCFHHIPNKGIFMYAVVLYNIFAIFICRIKRQKFPNEHRVDQFMFSFFY